MKSKAYHLLNMKKLAAKNKNMNSTQHLPKAAISSWDKSHTLMDHQSTADLPNPLMTSTDDLRSQ